MTVVVRLGTAADLPAVAELYRQWGYRAAAQLDDTLIVAALDRRVIGVVRLVSEHGCRVLRGMRVQPEFQRSGVGSRMLRLLVDQLQGAECFAIPYAHLLAFYGKAGFAEIPPAAAPAFLAERASAYRAEGLDIVVTRRPPERGDAPSGDRTTT